MMYMYADIHDTLKQWGVENIIINTLAESKPRRGCLECDTDV